MQVDILVFIKSRFFVSPQGNKRERKFISFSCQDQKSKSCFFQSKLRLCKRVKDVKINVTSLMDEPLPNPGIERLRIDLIIGREKKIVLEIRRRRFRRWSLSHLWVRVCVCVWGMDGERERERDRQFSWVKKVKFGVWKWGHRHG